MNRILIYPYSNQSKSALLLKEALGAQFIKKQNSQYVPRSTDLVINWGGGDCSNYPPSKRLNYSGAVCTAIDKIYTLTRLTTKGVSTLQWTTDINVAKEWLNSGKSVVVRGTTTGSGGKGIEIYTPSESLSKASFKASNDSGYQGTWSWLNWLKNANTGSTELFYLPTAPLYTQLIQKEAEFRVHVGGNKAIHTQMKLRKTGVEAKDVWNHDNGYTFTSQLDGRIASDTQDSCKLLGVQAVAALGLDFGAIDIAWANGKPYVLEVNTAPGIEEPTISAYVKYFKEQINV